MAETIQTQLRKGTLELCVLGILSRGETYAYRIANSLLSGMGISEGTIYPLMRRLINEQLVTTRLDASPNGPARKYYSLTAAGELAFENYLREWRTFTTNVEKLLAGE